MSGKPGNTHTIRPAPGGKFIEMKVRGEVTRESALRQNLEAHALGQELGIHRYLVDVTEARNVDSVMDDYNFSYADMQKTPGIDRRAVVAMLVSPGDHSHDFIETLSRNTGLNVTLFRDRRAAVRHLIGDDAEG